MEHGVTFTDALLAEAQGSWLGWAFVTLVVTVVLGRVFPGRSHRRLPASVWLFGVQVIVMVVVALLAALGNDAANETRIAQRVLLAMAWVGMSGALLFGVVLPRTRFPVSRILQDLVVGAATVAVVAAVLHRQGIALSGLFATSAVVTAVIGFSLQDTLGNTIGGLALQLDNSVQVGDWITIAPGTPSGRVTEIRWRYTAIETRGCETIIIPNSVLMKSQVVVHGRRLGAPCQLRHSVDFFVDFRTSPTDVIRTVRAAVVGARIENVASSPAPHVLFLGIRDSFAHYAVRFWLADLAIDDPTDSEVRTRLYFALRRAGIPMSIPAAALFVTEDDHSRQERKLADEHAR